MSVVNCCRSCLSMSKDTQNLFQKYEDEFVDDELGALHWSDCYQLVTDLNVTENDEFPKFLCRNCASRLKDAWDFRKLSAISENIFRNRNRLLVPDNNEKSTAELFIIEVNKLRDEDGRPEGSITIASSEAVPEIVEEVYDDNDRELEIDEDFREENEEKQITYKEIPKPVQKGNKKKTKYVCELCQKEFLTNQRLKLHGYVHSGEKNFACDKCSKKFATDFRLRTHYRTHSGEKPYFCDICHQRFAQGNALKCHKRTHTGERPYVCKICNKSFSQNTILKTHMTLHTGKTVKCPDCDKYFSRKSYLILHRREHTGEKPYICDKCPNRYYQKSHLDRHLDTHNGIKYRCNECGKSYSKAWSLKVHSYSHSNQKPFVCKDCNASFTRHDKYKAHIKKNHSQEEKQSVKGATEIHVHKETSKEVTLQIQSPHQIVHIISNSMKN